MTVRIITGDCRDELPKLPDASVDAIVTDPPYGLSFMGKSWDYDVPAVEIWRECLRVLKPGGHLLAFAGTRTQHRMAVNIEDAGFEIRDMIAWVYGSGFPKSLDVSKAIDKAVGAEREVLAIGKATKRMIPGADQITTGSWVKDNGREYVPAITAPATEQARHWQGWGTALKPSLEPITVARKPLAGTVAANVLAHGTGGLNIDGCRVGTETVKVFGPADGGRKFARKYDHNGENLPAVALSEHTGRWPANLIHDGSDEVVARFPADAPSGGHVSRRNVPKSKNAYGDFGTPAEEFVGYQDSGSAARFFYCAKADAGDRGHGNNHPTVKPADLMRYLCRLVTPPGGTVLDPFAGSGSTLLAADREGFHAIGIELSAEYAAIARRRITGDAPLFAEVVS